VTDTGPGITREDQQVIFNAFERGQANSTSKREGIGLGLHICAQLTNLTGGDISVRSEIGHGSTFTVSWPLAPANGV
jgi:signal transduction histidine kinase